MSEGKCLDEKRIQKGQKGEERKEEEFGVFFGVRGSR